MHRSIFFTYTISLFLPAILWVDIDLTVSMRRLRPRVHE